MRNAEGGMRNEKKTIKSFLLLVSAVVAVLLPFTTMGAGPLGKRIVLKNGMVLLLAEKHEIPMVTVSMAIKAGGVAEPADKPGLASLTAALMTQGTTSRSANQ